MQSPDALPDAPEERVPARILITGAGGFVGRHALAAFAAALRPGDRLAGLGRSRLDQGNYQAGRHPGPGLPPGCTYHVLDLEDRDGLRALLAAFRPNRILHLAAQASVGQAAQGPAETWRTNLVGLLNLAEAAAAEVPGATFLFASSGEVYGRAFLSGACLDESVPPEPAGAYARSKRAGEMLLADLLPRAGLRLIVARPFNHLGRGQDERFAAASFAGQIARIEAGLAEPVLEVGDLTAQRDFLDVRDVVRAYRTLLRGAEGLPMESVFNIASGRARPIGEILDMLAGMAACPFERRAVPERMRSAEIATASGDAGALTRAVGWRPIVPLADALAEVLDGARLRAGGARAADFGGTGAPATVHRHRDAACRSAV